MFSKSKAFINAILLESSLNKTKISLAALLWSTGKQFIKVTLALPTPQPHEFKPLKPILINMQLSRLQ